MKSPSLAESARFRRLASAATLALAATVGAGCSSKSPGTAPATVPTEAGPASADDAGLATASDSADPAAGAAAATEVTGFASFAIKDFNWEIQGYDVFTVDADGKAMWLEAHGYQEGSGRTRVLVARWHRADWTLSKTEVDGLVSQLRSAEFRKLDKLYIDRSVSDGQNVEFILRDAAGEKRVTCSNKFPPQIQQLRLHVRDLIEPQRADLKKRTPPIERDDAKAIWEAI